MTDFLRNLSLSFGALIQIRTGDLVLTKDALCRLSYKSKNRTKTSAVSIIAQ